MNGKEKHQAEELIQEDVFSEDSYTLWLINDNFNTFDYVIDNLMELCNHSYEQAYQCAFIAHNHGKCDILWGLYAKLKPIAIAMLNRGLTVIITP
ncbi:MAG: ATP-dependent Clp protease adaptor ClpS [Bacteroidales bacterium]|jgi:ATP-dependent Clp protease adaptor protein ClpS|nr:ATP-dependent Clp protease adaptor ClpS [Bacteroidales bacterium]